MVHHEGVLAIRREARDREDLIDAIHGNGAFLGFKSAIRRYHIEQDRYDFRDNALRDIAI